MIQITAPAPALETTMSLALGVRRCSGGGGGGENDACKPLVNDYKLLYLAAKNIHGNYCIRGITSRARAPLAEDGVIASVRGLKPGLNLQAVAQFRR